MIDPKVLRDEPDRVRAALAKRGLSDEVVSRSLEADTSRRRRAEVIDHVAAAYILQGALDRLRHLREA